MWEIEKGDLYTVVRDVRFRSDFATYLCFRDIDYIFVEFFQASVQCRQEEMSCGETKEKEKGDDLSLFVDFNGANLDIDLHKKSNQFQDIFGS